MICSKCGTELTPLFTSAFCAWCEAATTYSVGWVVWRNSPIELPIAVRVFPTPEDAADANTDIKPGAVIPCGTNAPVRKTRFALAYMTRAEAEASCEPYAVWIDDVSI